METNPLVLDKIDAVVAVKIGRSLEWCTAVERKAGVADVTGRVGAVRK